MGYKVKRIMMWQNGVEKQVRPVIPPYLCFTANTAGSTVQLTKTGSPTSVTLETSTDGRNWSTYTFGTTITLTNIGDKVYMRNTSETDTYFSDRSNYYQFVMTGSIAGSGDITYLVNKNGTTTLTGEGCFNRLFYNCSALTSSPSLPATTLPTYCYQQMFYGCNNLTTIPSLPATTLPNYCYDYMFFGAWGIKLSSTQTGGYQTAYRIPANGTGTAGSNSMRYMFEGSGGSWTGTPSINTTYYTSNTVV